jgi:predicted amidohydrolase YtcJ
METRGGSVKMHMKRKRWVLFLALAAVLVALAMLATSASAGAASKAADMVLLNGKVVTVDKQFTIEQAVAVRDGVIIDVGKNAQIAKYLGPNTKVIDLQGKELLPGVNDGHAHVAGMGSQIPPLQLNLNYPGIKTIADVTAAVQARAAQLDAAGDPTGWIRGMGWNEALLNNGTALPDLNSLNATQLDAGAHPVYLTDFSGHAVWVNTVVLNMVTIPATDPPGGVIQRNPDGSPTGVFREGPATRLVGGLAPPLSVAEQREGLLNGIHEMTKNGITSYTEPMMAPGSTGWNLYLQLYNEGALKARVALNATFGGNFTTFKNGMDSYSRPTGFDPQWLQFPGVKIWADGIPPQKTAWMWEPYVTGGYGSLTLDGANDQEKYDNLVNMIAYAYGKGYQVTVHATGDRTLSAVLDGLQLGHKLYPSKHDSRDYIIHGEYVKDSDYARLQKLGVSINMQPFIIQLNAEAAAHIVGPDLAVLDWPARSVIDAGIKLMFSSDTNVTYPNWRAGVQAAVLREGYSGYVNGIAQAVTRQEAIRAYTINGAYQDHMDTVKGSIEKGKVADFCVLGGDILTVDAHHIGTIPVQMTILGGKIIYDPANGIN